MILNKRHGTRFGFVCDVKCDIQSCGKVRENVKYSQVSKKKFHFCNRICLNIAQQKGGIVCEERLLSRDEVVWQKKLAETMTGRYGTDNASKVDEFNEKKAATWHQNFQGEAGIDLRRRREETTLQHYGVKYAMQAEEVKEKTRQTCLLRYGVENPYQAEEFKEKSHLTRKANRSYSKSRFEDAVFDRLNDSFENIQRQVKVNGWAIDFYIADIDVYLQADGVYWHGLDRDIDVIRACRTEHDATIVQTHARDLQQNEWFKKEGKRLLRVTDRDFYDDPDCLLRLFDGEIIHNTSRDGSDQ